MAFYRLADVTLDGPEPAVAAYEALFANCLNCDQRVAIGASCDSEGVLDAVVTAGDIRVCSLFGWCESSLVGLAEMPESGMFAAGYADFGSCVIRFSEPVELPLADWDENLRGAIACVVERRTEGVSEAAVTEVRLQVIECLNQIGIDHTQFRFSEMWSGKNVTVMCSFEVCREALTSLLKRISKVFPDKRGPVSLEISRGISEVRRIAASGSLNTSSYPHPIGSLNSFDVPFAVGTRVHLLPFPNCRLSRARDVLETAWKLRDHVRALRLTRSFLSWGSDGTWSTSRMRGNTCELLMQDTGISVGVGLEPELNARLPANAVLARLQRSIAHFGGSLVRSGPL